MDKGEGIHGDDGGTFAIFKFYDMIQGEGDENYIVDVEEVHSDFGIENRN